MRSLAIVCLLAGVALADRPADPLARLRRAAGCAGATKTASSPWCAARWVDGTPAALPTGKVLAGIMVEVRDDKPALGEVLFSALAISSDGGEVKAEWIVTRGDGDDSNAQAVAALSAVFTGKAKVASLPPDLTAAVTGELGRETVRADGSGWAWTDFGGNKYQLRRVGAFWVLRIEVSPAARDSWQRHPIAIFTDAWK